MTKFTRREVSTNALGLVVLAGCATAGTTVTQAKAAATTATRDTASKNGAATYLSTPADYFDTTPAPFPEFSIAPETPKARFDFTAFTNVFRQYVVDLGPSDRFIPSKPRGQTGSRFSKGHTSDYRLEGSRILFAALKREEKKLLTRVPQALAHMGSQRPLSDYSWLDQMSFWMNLHNALIIGSIADKYPVKFPSRMKVGSPRSLLHDAKLVEVQGVPLSLRDIRVEIVYRHWQEPLAAYGFFHGVVGSPRLDLDAFNAENITLQLNNNAGEYINSLRGVREGNDVTRVSRLYSDATPLFKDLESDLRPHLQKFADDETSEILAKQLPIKLDQFEERVADLSGGDTSIATSSFTPSTGVGAAGGEASGNPDGPGEGVGSSPLSTSTLRANATRLPDHATGVLREIEQKHARLRRQNRFNRRRGTVIIEDINTSPQNEDSNASPQE